MKKTVVMRSVTPAALDQCCQLVHMPAERSADSTYPNLVHLWTSPAHGSSSNLPQLTMVNGQFKTPQNLRSKFLDDFPKKVFKRTFAHRAWIFFKTLYQPEMLGHFGIVSNMYSDGRSIFYPDYHESSLFLPMKPTVKNS